MNEFKGKTAVVTGAATGIGKGLVQTFVNKEMKVVMVDIDQKALSKSVKEFKEQNAEVLGIVTDVSQSDEMDKLVEKVYKEFKEVHILCNNAGIGYGTGFSWTHHPKDWDWMLGVNLMGIINGVNSFLPKMLEQRVEAHIINTSSIAGLNTGGGNAMYAVTKHGIVAYSECLYNDLAAIESLISVSVLCPGFVKSDILNPLKSYPKEMGELPPKPVSPAEMKVYEAMHEVIENSMDPITLGEKVIEGIKKESFYILTHEDSKESIKSRFDNIMNNKFPVSLPPKEIIEILTRV